MENVINRVGRPSNLDFKKIYVVNGYYLRLNKIMDYNPIGDSLTKVEFIKVKDVASFTATTTSMNGGVGGTF